MNTYQNRREFLRTAALGTAAFALLGRSNTAAKKVAAPPNIIFIMSDDHATHAMSCYGSKINKTPNLDRIASEGMKFENCFCTNSICTPSRATVLTGKYSHKNGTYVLNTAFDRDQASFPKLLQTAGYHTGVIGKWHLGTEPAGFDYYNLGAGYFNPRMKESGTPWTERGKLLAGYTTDKFTDIGIDFMKNRPQEKPFCLLLHYSAPHDPWQYDKKHEHIYADRDVPEPDNLMDNYENRSTAIRQCTEQIGYDCTIYRKQTSHLKGDARKKAQYQIYMKSYVRCVASIDDNVNRILDYLDKEGLTDNTLLVYTSDQGFFLGDHGLFDKRFMYEESLRIPFLVRYPKEVKAGSVNKDMVLNVDFAETLLDCAGLPIPSEMQGQSLRPLLNGKSPDDWRKSMYYRYWAHRHDFEVPAHYGVRTVRHKLIYYYGLDLIREQGPEATEPEWELFDLEKDPREMNNVYGDPAYANTVKELKAELRRLKEQLEDTDEQYPELLRVQEEYW
ncbi:MAG: sulfatase family protein [Planctomycetota bacterium]